MHTRDLKIWLVSSVVVLALGVLGRTGVLPHKHLQVDLGPGLLDVTVRDVTCKFCQPTVEQYTLLPKGSEPTLPDCWSPAVREAMTGMRCVIINHTGNAGSEVSFKVPPAEDYRPVPVDPDMLPPATPLRDAVMVPQWAPPVQPITSTQPGAVDGVAVMYLHVGQWGWVPNTALVRTPHGLKVDAQYGVRDRPFEGGMKVARHASGTLHVYPRWCVGDWITESNPAIVEGDVRIHWINK